jgi:hypothetical protein
MPKHYVIRRKLNQNQHTPQYFSTTPNPSRMKISAIQGLPRPDPRQTVKDESYSQRSACPGGHFGGFAA